jgi:UDP-N-acetyl-D-galactosamine dehydrogenase
LAVAHKEFLKLDVRSLTPSGIVYDVKGILPKEIIDSRL